MFLFDKLKKSVQGVCSLHERPKHDIVALEAVNLISLLEFVLIKV